MNNRTENDKLQKDLMNAISIAKKSRADMETKEMERMWRDIQVPTSLYDALSRLTKDELTNIRQQLEIKNASSLKKEELIRLLEQIIPTRFENICLKIDSERYHIIEKSVHRGGSVSAEHLSLNLLKNLESYGIVFTGSYHGEKVAVLPSELMEAFQSVNHTNIKAIAERNTEWIKLTHGLLHYYGVVSVSKLIELVKKHSTYDLGDSIEFLHVIRDAEQCYGNLRADWEGFSDARVFDAEHVRNEQKKRQEIPYYPFSKSALMTAGEPDYVEQNKSTRQFTKFLMQYYDVSRKEAEMHVDQCGYGIKLGETPDKILALLQHQFELKGIDDVKLFMEHLMNLSNNTRQWFLKGYTAKELQELEGTNWQPASSQTGTVIDFQSKKKVGRNDPCPCGSGKKYKKCCGR